MNISTWFTHSFHKTQLEECNNGVEKYIIYAAKNQYGACQLVIKNNAEVSNVEITCDGLFGENGSMLKIEMFKVCYIDCAKHGIWPDPIPPLNKPVDLKAGCVQPVLLRVYVPMDAFAGTYEGSINIKVNGGNIRRCELSVHVWDFSLPITPTCQTAFGISKNGLSTVYAINEDSAECRALYKRYYDELLNHKISAFEIPVDIMTEEANVYLDDERMTSFVIPYDADQKKLGLYMDKIRSNKLWFQKGMFYPLDEPRSKGDYEKLDEIHKKLRSIEPNYRMVLPFYTNPNFDKMAKAYDLMLGKINVWCPESCLLDNINYWDQDREPDYTLCEKLTIRRNTGENSWWYVCCGPAEPYCNLFITMSGLQHRLLFWQQWEKGIEGLLYWCTNWWDGTNDPWTDMATVKGINSSLYGDGSLFYPDHKAETGGPISSLRLEAVRDGIDDYEYLVIAEKILGRNYVIGLFEEIIASLTEYTGDEELFVAIRIKLAKSIEHAIKITRRISPGSI